MPPADHERIIESCQFVWQGIVIEVEYEPNWLSSLPGPYGYAHLDIYAIYPERAPWPITETGYRSHFLRPGEVEDHGGLEGFVRAWLDAAAKSKKWQTYLAKTQQLSLF